MAVQTRAATLFLAAVHTALLATFVASTIVVADVVVAGALPGSSPRTVDAVGSTSRFEPVQPCRLADERVGSGFVALDAHTARIDTSACGIPDAASAVVVSTTIVGARRQGWLLAYPAGGERPLAATLNWNVGTTRANTATVAVGPGGQIDVYRSDGFGNGGVVVDVVGAFVPADTATRGRLVVPPTAARLLDTRVDGGVPLGADSVVRIPLPDGVPADASALAVDLTAVDTAGTSYFTLYPAGSDRPEASVLNADGAHQTRAAATIVPVTAEGFDLYASAGAHVVVDMTGWFTGDGAAESADGLFVPTSPQRLRDTRPENAPIYRDGSIEVGLPAAVGAPAAVAVSMTLVAPDERGFITAHAARTARGETSSGFAMPFEVTAQFGISAASSAGIEIYSSAGTELTVDLFGWFTGPGVATTTSAPAPNPIPLQHVIAIGDSTLAGIDRNQAWGQLRGASFDLRARSCRRLVRESCRGREGPIPPPNALAELRSLPYGAYDVAVIMTGYNDGYTSFAPGIPLIIEAARSRGIRRIIWLTHAREFRSDRGGPGAIQVYEQHNAAIRYHAGVNDDVVAAEWSNIVRQVPFWVYADGIHLDRYGASGNADFISRAVAHVTGRPCPMPQYPGAPNDGVCPDPGTMPPVDIARLYGI